MISIEELMKIASNQKASDVHITVGVPPKMRLNGELINMDFPILMSSDTDSIISKIMNQRQMSCYEEKGEVDFSFSIPNIGRCRANVFKQRGSMAAALRLISNTIPTPEELGLPKSIVDLYQKRRGLILVTGPTGSGKSTTLASLINLVNESTNSHVITLEDPIEYLHHHKKGMINQREIGLDTKSYADALRAALREDPDVILVGEMRDLETISIAITAAETGHLVLSSLHTIGAVSTIDRVIDVFPPHQQQQIRVQLATVLEAVISQQLIPTIDGRGRIAAFEVMHMNTAIKNQIRESKSHQITSIIDTNRKSGMISMDNALYELYIQGKISADHAISFAQDNNAMQSRVLG